MPRAEPVPSSEFGHYPVHVRFTDVDVYGHVNNVKYFEYFQEARLLFITNRLMAQVPRELGLPSFVIAQTDVDYKRADPVPGRALRLLVPRSPRSGAGRSPSESEIRDGDAVLARAVVTVVFVDPETGRSAEPPEEYRAPLLAARDQT